MRNTDSTENPNLLADQSTRLRITDTTPVAPITTLARQQIAALELIVAGLDMIVLACMEKHGIAPGRKTK